MAGGSGQRFWPLSRTSRPKQLLNLASPDRSLLAQAVDRATALVDPRDVTIATARHLVEPIREASLGIPPENVIGEPCKRNTAGCLVYAAASILATTGAAAEDILMGILTADHRIIDEAAFQGTVSAAFEAAAGHPALVTVGIQPTRPETGYGYIETGDRAEPIQGAGTGFPIFRVLRFHEKPDAESAAQYCERGGFYWNSGMFFWRLSSFLGEFEHAEPQFGRACLRLADALRAGDNETADRVFQALPDRSIDYALMENARHVLMARGRFRWDDVGAWDALERSLPRDSHGNVQVGDPVLLDAANCVVVNAPGADAMAVGVIGVRDLIVVVSRDGVLVVPKDQAQRVRDVVEELGRRGAPQV
ncbi:MAG: mannose-1-phosphate guanylyltransferase [Lentisphaeria bacterium]|nr:mannose-1-phosphate guanylyltransferase [Lentisphaeria bacterium]